MIRISLFTVATLLLLSCSSPPVKNQFYTLNNQLVLTGTNSPAADAKLIVVDNIVLADYLRQQGIVIKESSNRIQISKTHRWAEGLSSALARNISDEMRTLLPEFRVETVGSRWNSQPFIHVKIEISQFEVENNNHQVIHAGRFWILDEQNQLLASRRFSLTEKLSQNGFEFAVSKLQLTVSQLSQLVANEIPQDNN